MPELPEVETTTKGLQKTIVGLAIKDIWTNLSTKNKRYWNWKHLFRKGIITRKVVNGRSAHFCSVHQR